MDIEIPKPLALVVNEDTKKCAKAWEWVYDRIQEEWAKVEKDRGWADREVTTSRVFRNAVDTDIKFVDQPHIMTRFCLVAVAGICYKMEKAVEEGLLNEKICKGSECNIYFDAEQIKNGRFRVVVEVKLTYNAT